MYWIGENKNKMSEEGKFLEYIYYALGKMHGVNIWKATITKKLVSCMTFELIEN